MTKICKSFFISLNGDLVSLYICRHVIIIIFFIIDHSLPHQLPGGRRPLASLHYAEGAVTQLLKQRQVLLWDEARQRLLLAVQQDARAGGLRAQEPLPQHERRRGRQFPKGGGGLPLLGEVRPIWTLPTEHLQQAKAAT